VEKIIKNVRTCLVVLYPGQPGWASVGKIHLIIREERHRCKGQPLF